MNTITIEPEVIGDERTRYALPELKGAVEQITGRTLSDRTFFKWRGFSQIIPGEDDLYSHEDLTYLVELNNWLASPGRRSVKGFRAHCDMKKTVAA